MSFRHVQHQSALAYKTQVGLKKLQLLPNLESVTITQHVQHKEGALLTRIHVLA